MILDRLRAPTVSKAVVSYKSAQADRVTAMIAENAEQGWPNLGSFKAQAEAFGQSSWVYVAVDRLAKACSLVALNVYRFEADKKTRLPNHPLEALFRTPNASLTQAEFMYQTVGFLELTGNMYWYIDGRDELIPLRPDRVRIVPGSSTKEPIQGYVYEINQMKVPLDAEDVVHFKLFSPSDDYYGMAPLVAAALSVQTDLSMQRFNRNYFGKEKAVPTGLVSIQTLVTDTEFKRIKQEWENNYGGERRKTAIVRGADVKWQEMGTSHHEMDFMLGREFLKEEIFQIHGIPPGLMDKTATEANANAAMELFTGNTIWPLMNFLTQKISQRVAVRFGKNLVVEPEDIRRKDAAAERAEAQAYAGIMTINEQRLRYLGLPPVPWGDIPAAGAGAAAITGQSVAFDKLPKDVRQTPGDAIARQKEQQAEGGKTPPQVQQPKEAKSILRPVYSNRQREEMAQFARYAAKGKDVELFSFTRLSVNQALACKALADIRELDVLTMKGIVLAADRIGADGVRDPFAAEKEQAARKLSTATAQALSALQTAVVEGIRHVDAAAKKPYADYFDSAWWRAALADLVSALYTTASEVLEDAALDQGDMIKVRDGYDYDPSAIGPDVNDTIDSWAKDVLPGLISTTRDGLDAILARWDASGSGDTGDFVETVQSSLLFGQERADRIADTENTRLWIVGLSIAVTAIAENTQWTVEQAVTTEQVAKVIPVHTGCVCRGSDVVSYDPERKLITIDYRFHTLKDGHTVCIICTGYDNKLFSEILSNGE